MSFQSLILKTQWVGQWIRVFTSLLLVVLLVIASGPVSAIDTRKVANKCEPVEVVFARGSGQTLENSQETNQFYRQLDMSLKKINLTTNLYELGSEPQNGHQYNAVSIDWENHKSNLIGAEFFWGSVAGSEYRQSVKNGVNEFLNYMRDRSFKCSDSVFVVGGYSQGAQAIGDALPYLSPEVAEKIVHVSFFGDPKLYLPEGEGQLPPACRANNDERSPWRRGVPSCLTHEGILEARKPYLPDNFTRKTGSWCNYKDPICTNELLTYNESTHSKYATPGGSVDEAAKEAAQAVAKLLDISGLIIEEYDLGFGTAGFDVAIVLDVTASMEDVIYQAQRYATELAEFVTKGGGRVAVVDFRDKDDMLVEGENAARVRTDFTKDMEHIQYIMSGEYAEGGGDPPEAGLSALMTSFNKLSWQQGAVKSVILITDNAYHDPDVATGYTLEDVRKRALEIDPVNVFPVVPESTGQFYEELAAQTGGKVMGYKYGQFGDSKRAMQQVTSYIVSKPVVLLSNLEYFARPGDTVYFDVSRSYDPDSTITKYEWDFDADGVFDKTTDSPATTHVYDAPFEGLMEVRAYAADGGIANGSAIMHITSSPVGGSVPSALTGLRATAQKSDDAQVVSLSWAASQGAEDYKIYANDELLGLTNGPLTNVNIKDVPNSGPLQFKVAASNAYGDGQSASVAITIAEPEQQPVGTPEENEVADEVTPQPAEQKVSTITLQSPSNLVAAAVPARMYIGNSIAIAPGPADPSVLGTTETAKSNEPASATNQLAKSDENTTISILLIATLLLAAGTFVVLKFTHRLKNN